MKYTKIEDAISRLEEISNLDGAELGEAWRHLIDLYDYKYCFSTEFNVAVITEIFKQAEESHEKFEIVEVDAEITPLKYKEKILREKIK